MDAGIQLRVVLCLQAAQPDDRGDFMESSQPPPRPEEEEAAEYIAALARELRTLAAKADLGFIAYLLGMVEDEASAAIRQSAGPRTGTSAPSA